MAGSADALKPHPSSPNATGTSESPNTIIAPAFRCDHPGCNANSFKRHADFTRHQRIHTPEKEYSCPAQGCKRYGARGFSRKDKLIDHILDGHDDDTILLCPSERCSAQLTRTFFFVHRQSVLFDQFVALRYYRTCPMPRCGFRVHVTERFECVPLDRLQDHIRNSHDMNGRTNYANTLRERGYDYRNGDITCPFCPIDSFFSNHLAFQMHLIDCHTENSDVSIGKPRWCQCDSMSAGLRCLSCLGRLSLADSAPQHRETLLSLIPRKQWHPMFRDIRCKGRY